MTDTEERPWELRIRSGMDHLELAWRSKCVIPALAITEIAGLGSPQLIRPDGEMVAEGIVPIGQYHDAGRHLQGF